MFLGVLGLSNHEDFKVGVTGGEEDEENVRFKIDFSVENKSNGEGAGQVGKDECENDDISTSSSDSDGGEDPHDEHVMHIVGRIENGVRCITVIEEDLIWDMEVLL